MSLETIALTIQLITAILLIIVVLAQNRGAALGQAFGGSGTFFGERRGVEKTLYYATIVLSVIFFLTSIWLLFL